MARLDSTQRNLSGSASSNAGGDQRNLGGLDSVERSSPSLLSRGFAGGNDSGWAGPASPIRLARPSVALREYLVLNFDLIAFAISEKVIPRAIISRSMPDC